MPVQQLADWMLLRLKRTICDHAPNRAAMVIAIPPVMPTPPVIQKRVGCARCAGNTGPQDVSSGLARPQRQRHSRHSWAELQKTERQCDALLPSGVRYNMGDRVGQHR